MPENGTVLIDAATVQSKTPYTSLVPAIEDAFAAYYEGDAEMPSKSYVDVPAHNGDFRSMPAYIHTEDVNAAGLKWVNVHPENESVPTVMAVMLYNDPATGEPLAILDGTELTGRRTGAAAGVATDNLAPGDVSTVGIVGAGAQAYEQVRAIAAVRDFDTILVSDPDDDAVAAFRETFDDDYAIETGSPTEAAHCDVVSTTTPVTDPIIDGVGEGTHVNAMGADAPAKKEFETHVVMDVDTHVFVDDIEQGLHSGEVSRPYHDGPFTDGHLAGTLGQAVAEGVDDLRDETTIFDSTGLAIQDVATAHLVYDALDADHDHPTFGLV